MIEKSSYIGPALQVIVAVYFLFVSHAVSAHHKIKKGWCCISVALLHWRHIQD